MPRHSLSRRTLIKSMPAAGVSGYLGAAWSAPRQPDKHSVGVEW